MDHNTKFKSINFHLFKLNFKDLSLGPLSQNFQTKEMLTKFLVATVVNLYQMAGN